MPWDGSQPLFRIGLSPLELRNWIEPDEMLLEQLEEKDRLLADRKSDVFVAEADTLEAQGELHGLLVAHLTSCFPQIWQAQAGAVRNVANGRTVPFDPLAPIIAAARLVQEDLVLMRRGEEGWRLAAGCVCFPSEWVLTEKFGKPLAHIHGPVPNFGPNSRNADMIHRIFDNLKPEQPVWRMNWSLYPDARLFHGEARVARRSGDLAQTFLRVEYQTLRKLAGSGDIVFGIRIHLDPATLIGRHAEKQRLATGLRKLILQLDGDELAYKGLTEVRSRLIEQLDAIAGA